MNAHPSSLSDRELIELAAKAAGITLAHNPFLHNRGAGALTAEGMWNPLEDDGDALRLAVKLWIDVCHDKDAKCVDVGTVDTAWLTVPYGKDPAAATRRGVVTVAASLAK